MQASILDWVLQLKKDIGKIGKIQIRCNPVNSFVLILSFSFDKGTK